MKRRRKPRPAEGPLDPAEWNRLAYERTGGREELHSEKMAWPGIESEVHHVLSKSWLRRNGLHHLVWDERNSMVLRTDDHSRHELAVQRVPVSRIREETWEFIHEIGPGAVAEIERKYSGELPRWEGTE